MSGLITFGLGAGAGGTNGAFSQVNAVLGEIGAYGSPSYQPDPNAAYQLMRDGNSIERVGGGTEVGKAQYAVPGGTRIDRYDAAGHVISSVFVPNP